MAKITEELSVKYVKSFLQYGADIGEMIAKLEKKGKELGDVTKNLEELEGESEIKDKLHILKKCPMVQVLDSIKKANAALTGEEALPGFYPEIVEEYIKKYPEDAAILHPLCIVHQYIRKAFGEKHGLQIQQIACRSGATGKVVYSKKGLKEAGIDEKEVDKLIGDCACLYICEKK